jgi:hypothetical protein
MIKLTLVPWSGLLQQQDPDHIFWQGVMNVAKPCFPALVLFIQDFRQFFIVHSDTIVPDFEMNTIITLKSSEPNLTAFVFRGKAVTDRVFNQWLYYEPGELRGQGNLNLFIISELAWKTHLFNADVIMYKTDFLGKGAHAIKFREIKTGLQKESQIQNKFFGFMSVLAADVGNSGKYIV